MSLHSVHWMTEDHDIEGLRVDNPLLFISL